MSKRVMQLCLVNSQGRSISATPMPSTQHRWFEVDRSHLCPPTHHHCHDYCLTIDDRYPVVVGEAMSGENYPDELQKCMPGVMKMLNIYETAISMTSSSSHVRHILLPFRASTGIFRCKVPRYRRAHNKMSL